MAAGSCYLTITWTLGNPTRWDPIGGAVELRFGYENLLSTDYQGWIRMELGCPCKIRPWGLRGWKPSRRAGRYWQVITLTKQSYKLRNPPL